MKRFSLVAVAGLLFLPVVREVLPATILSVGVLTGCSSQLSYSPSPVPTRQDALKMVERLLREQPPAYAPETVEVTDDFFAVVDVRRAVLTGGSIPVGQTVYFDSVHAVRLYGGTRWFNVTLLDETETPLFRYYHTNRDKAQRFFDAISSLKGR